MLAKRLYAVGRRLHDAFHHTFRKSTLFFLDKHIHHIAGHCAFHKNSESLCRSAYSFPSVGDAMNGDIGKYNMFFCHF